jgi:hypothetical protein
MNNQDSVNWSQLWYHINGISDLKDRHRVTILKNYAPKLNTFTIPITWNFAELHILSFKQTHGSPHKGKHWPDHNLPSFRKSRLPIMNRTMDRVIIFSDDHEKINAGSHIISEAKRILIADGRLTMVIKAKLSNPDIKLSEHLNKFGFSNIIVGHYMSAKKDDLKASNIIIATATQQNMRRVLTNGNKKCLTETTNSSSFSLNH